MTTLSAQQTGRNTGSARPISDLFLENLPPELTRWRHWVPYRLGPVKANGKRDKILLNPRTGRYAKVNNPKTWGTFEEAVAAYCAGMGDGIGFVFTAEDPYVGIDLDECRNPQTGHLEAWAQDIVERLDSYTEASPSGTGVHILASGKLPGGGGETEHVEMYETGRFFTITGEHVGGTPIICAPRQAQITDLYHRYFSHKLTGNGVSQSTPTHGALSADERQQILTELRAALPSIPAVEHDIWREVGMGVHHVDSGRAGFDLWVEWSQRCPEKFDLTDCQKRWRSFHDDGGITHRSIFKLAIDHGWQQTGTGDAAAQGKKPGIEITADLTTMVNQTEAALLKLPGPVLYQRSRQLVRIAPAGPSPTWLQRPEEAPIIAPASLAALREYASHAARWTKRDKRTKTQLDVLPSAVVLETLAARTEWRFPYLEGVIAAPTLRPDGVLLQTPGYDQETGLYLDLNSGPFPPIPETPTRNDAIRALNHLYEPFSDFPFADDCHRSATLAALLTLNGRYAIRGCTPLFAVRAHSRGTGKGLLVNTIAMIGTGRPAPTWQHTENEEEDAKRLLSIAIAGDQCAHIDNVTTAFGSGPLDSVITAASIKGRLLGTNTNQEAPWTTVLFASGNNMTFTGDMVRRVIPIDLDAQTEHPEERGGFRHARLLEWVRHERPRLVTAALTVLKVFFHASCPKQPNLAEYGSFEAWSDLIRHCLVWCGFADPCGGRKHLEAESDTTYEALAELLRSWEECYPDGKAYTLKTITQDIEQRKISDPSAVDPANEWNKFHDALSSYDDKHDGKRLNLKKIGHALRGIEGRVLEGQRIIRNGEEHKVTKWQREANKRK